MSVLVRMRRKISGAAHNQMVSQEVFNMQIAELKNGSSRVNITGKVVEKGKSRQVNTRFGSNEVADAIIEDASGTITLVLWGEEIMKINEGDNVKIENGYVKEWNGTLQLSVGRFGKITVL